VLQQLRDAVTLHQGGQQTHCLLCMLQLILWFGWRHCVLLYLQRGCCNHKVEALCKDRAVLLVFLLVLQPVLL
jgi:hypothetical protein